MMVWMRLQVIRDKTSVSMTSIKVLVCTGLNQITTHCVVVVNLAGSFEQWLFKMVTVVLVMPCALTLLGFMGSLRSTISNVDTDGVLLSKVEYICLSEVQSVQHEWEWRVFNK